MTIPSSLQSYSFLNFDHKQCFESHNTSSLRDLLAKQNYHAVINSSKLFWQTFCLGACRIDKSENDFKFEEVNGCLSISGNPLRIKDLKLCLEDIREVFMENLHATKGFKITAYEFKIISTQIILKNFQPIIDHNFLNSHNKIHLSDFQNLIKPTMKAFCELIGANCKETIDSINYVLNDKSTTIEDTSFNIKLKNHLSYDLEPQKISKRKNQNIELYRLYQQQMLKMY